MTSLSILNTDVCKRSADLGHFNFQETGEAFDLRRNVANAYRAMVRRAKFAPPGDKLSCAAGESIPANGVANFHDCTGNRFTLGYQQFELARRGLDHRKKRYGAMFHAHLNGQAVADPPMVNLHWPNKRASLRN